MIHTAFPATARILVVDDSESNRYVLATWLRRTGYDVVEARTGAETLAAISRQSFDLVVLDVNLPDMSGYAVCEQIKSTPPTAALPVLHVSATATNPADLSEGLRRGAEGYLVEPVDREELVATVGALLRAAAAQRTAARLAWRLRQLNEATQAVNAATTLEGLVVTIATAAGALFERPALASIVAGNATITERSDPFAAIIPQPLTAQQVDALRALIGAGTRIPPQRLGRLVPTGRAAYLGAPLDHPDGHRGVLLVELPGAGPGDLETDDEIEVVLVQYARAASTALRNMRTFDAERHIALTLQHSLLPNKLPDVPGLEVAVRYVASTEHSEVGGDFYDVFSLDDERVIFALGDVAGHSIEAAAVMAQLRTGIRSFALDGHGPADILARLNRLLRRFHPDMTATACCAVYDRASGRCELANAGHVPPLVLRPASAEFLPVGGSLLGIEPLTGNTHCFALAPGDVLLLYTDGLVERRLEALDSALARLARSASEETTDVDALCERVLRDVGPSTVSDDIALLVIRRTAPG